jgi:MFS transporter, FSR family, fosmidomycin resistance protein
LNKTFKKPEVLTLSIAHLIHDIYPSFLAPLLPLLTAKLGMSLSMIALLDITRRAPSLLNPFFGLLAERTGIKYFVIFTPAITAVCMSLTGLSSSVPMLFILIFIAGLSAALFHLPSPVMIKAVSGDQVGTGMSFYMVGGELARTLGPLIITATVSYWSLEATYRLLPLGVAASAVLFSKLKNIEVYETIQKKKEKGDTRKLLKTYWPFLSVLTGFLLFQSAMKISLTLYLPVHLTNQGESLWFAGISLSILQFSGVFGAFFSGKISDKIGRRNTLLIASIGSAITMTLFLITNNIIPLAFLGLFMLSTGPVLLATVQDTNSNMPTFMNSIYMTINFGVGSAVVFFVGLSGDMLGLEKTYIISTVLALGSIPSAFFITKFIKTEKLMM